MTKKLCTFVGCKAIVDHNDDGSSPRCDKHKPKSKTTSKDRKLKYEHHYNEKGQSLYSTWKWKKLRNRKIAEQPICEICELVGVARPAKDVDHKLSVLDGGDFWDYDNLQSLCRPCHIRKTRKEEAERDKKRDSFGYIY